MELNKPLPYELERAPTQDELADEYEGFAAMMALQGGM